MKAVRNVHISKDEKLKLKGEIEALKYDIVSLTNSNAAPRRLNTSQELLLAKQATWNSLCHESYCESQSLVVFCASFAKPEYAVTRDLFAYTFCNVALTCDTDNPRLAQACVTGTCGRCGFQKRVLDQIASCPILTSDSANFEWTKWAEVKKVATASELLESVSKSWKRYETARTTLSATTPEGFAGFNEQGYRLCQAQVIKEIESSRKFAIMCQLKLQRRWKNSFRHSTTASVMKEKQQLTLAKLLERRSDLAKAFVPKLYSQRIPNSPPLFSDEPVILEEPGNSMRGAYNVTTQKGFSDFLSYVSVVLKDFFVHDFRRRWMEKQKRLAEENLKSGELLLMMDFSAKLEMIQSFWTQEDNIHVHSLTLLVILVGWRDAEGGGVNFRAFDYVSDDPETDAVWVHIALSSLFSTLSMASTTAAGQHIPALLQPGTRIHIVTDGGPHHFRCQVRWRLLFKRQGLE